MAEKKAAKTKGKQSVNEAELDIATGKVKDVKLLMRFLDDANDADKVRVLKRCVVEGSRRMVEAAFPPLASAAPAQAEVLALALAKRPAKKKTVAEQQTRWLTLVATPACLELATELGLPVSILSAGHMERALPWLPRGLSLARADSTSEEWLKNSTKAFTWALESPALAWFVERLDAPDTTAAERYALFCGFAEIGHRQSILRHDFPEELLPTGAFRVDTTECFDLLSPSLSRQPAHVALAVFASERMEHPADPRWVSYWLSRFDGQQEQVAALKAIVKVAPNAAHEGVQGAVRAIVDRLDLSVWSDDHVYWLRQAGEHNKVADQLMLGIAEAAADYNFRGHRRIAGLLSEFVSVARAEHVDQLAHHAAVVDRLTDGGQTPAMWFASAMRGIAARVLRR
jgi:hypothetical protein